MAEEKPQSNTRFRDFKESKDESTKVLTDVATNLKILEDRYINLRKKTQLTDQILIDSQREFSKEKRILNEEIMDIKTSIQEIREELETMRKELSETVKLKDYQVLDKYLDLWEPVRFMTRKEAEEIIKEELGK